MNTIIHVPVLGEEIVQVLQLQPHDNIIDGTLGEGGHTQRILEKTGPDGRVLGIDRDTRQLERAKANLRSFASRVFFEHSSFADLALLFAKNPHYTKYAWKGLLLDLGWSQVHIEESKRGFSFAKDEPLDMRYDTDQKLTAADIVNTYTTQDIARILKEYGEEPFAARIADSIVIQRKRKVIDSTFQLIEIIKISTPRWYGQKRIHPATKTFQALRIEVNQEYQHIERGLEEALDIISPGGFIAVISFHSGEDRIVKRKFQSFQKNEIGIMIPKKPLIAGLSERQSNPRSRSAKLRVFQINL